MQLKLSAIARVGVANCSIHRAEHKTSPGADRSRNPDHFESIATAIRRMVLHEPQ